MQFISEKVDFTDFLKKKRKIARVIFHNFHKANATFFREIKLEQNSLVIQFDGIFATKSWQQKSVISILMM